MDRERIEQEIMAELTIPIEIEILATLVKDGKISLEYSPVEMRGDVELESGNRFKIRTATGYAEDCSLQQAIRSLAYRNNRMPCT